jgi:hypothetical protein
MTEELSGVAVPSNDVPVAIDPALLNKPIRPEEQQFGGADADALNHKLGLERQHRKNAEKKAADAAQQLQQLQYEVEQLKTVQQSAVQKSLEDQGQFRQLWEDAKRTVVDRETQIAELKAQLNSVQQSAEQERLKAAATSQISQANAVNPTQLYMLLQSQLRMDDEGNPAVLSGGVEQPLGDYLVNLRQSADWQHHFGASSARGMGAAPTSAVAPGMSNPYREGNLTEAMRLEMTNPELAKALKVEAGRG